MTILFIK